MSTTPGFPDHVLVALSVVGSIVHWRWAYPRAVRQMAAGEPGARLRLYRYIIAVTWAGTLAVAAVWIAQRRPWVLLRIGIGNPWRFVAGLAVAAAYIALAALQRRAILARPDTLERFARTFGTATPLMPTSAAERRGFRAVSITAGICEELFYRGFMIWYVGAFAGPIVAILLSSLAFGFDHVYLGRTYIVRTGIGGLAFSLLVLLSGSLLPAVLVHIVADVWSGDIGERALVFAPRRAMGGC
jgi:CAAX protease family protein